MYSVYDTKSQHFSPPFFQVNEIMATRAFARAANDPASDIHAFPDDFTLYQVGTFDDNNANIDACLPPVLVINASSLIKGK